MTAPPADTLESPSGKRRHTMAEIARMAGVDVSTVSRALAGSPRVAEETRALINQIVRETGYVINEAGRALRERRANQVLVVVSDIAAPFYSDVVQGIVETLAVRGINTLLGVTLRQPEREAQLVKQLMTGVVDGIITVTGTIPEDILGMPDFHRKVVGISRAVPHEGVTSVMIDNYLAAREAMMHLYGMEHRRIAYIGGPTHSKTYRDRGAAYSDFMAEKGLSDMVNMRSTDSFVYDTQSGLRIMQSILQDGPRPTAVFCTSDELAIGAMAAARQAKLSVPDDVSVFGFDDLKVSALISPPLSTVSVPRFELGRVGAEILFRQIYDHEVIPAKVVLEHGLVLRDSVARVT
jgi:LacI family transcriptional regulator, repressor for deo operon, udp, cdd, tsx, nupC, and nupG